MSALILLVDDDEDIRDDLLRMKGFRVATAADGRAALDQLAAGSRPDAILLDLMMPTMDGAEFRRQQLTDEALARIPIIVLSAAADARAVAERLRAAGCVRKPVEIDDLFDSIRRALSVSAASPSA